ncbi:MAG: YggS family pyridoxal phosphate-dependent enzyme [Firmicutes bacterium]|nr:YggS family pyridoxal phosphate-dependent enzyme [Bacillota bacterium]
MTEKLSDRERQISEGMKRVFEKIEEAKHRSVSKRDVTVMGATKTVPAELIRYAHGIGLEAAGENRVNELCEKYEIGAYEGMRLDFIGRLQTNKVKYIVGKVDMIQSLDSLGLCAEIEKRYAAADKICNALIELNSGEEAAKGGVMLADAMSFADETDAFPHIRLCGVMTVAPFCEKKEDYKRFFEKTYKVFIDISTKKLHNINEPVLSMGMSDNYDVAVECGATLIRPGSAIFGKRPGNLQI